MAEVTYCKLAPVLYTLYLYALPESAKEYQLLLSTFGRQEIPKDVFLLLTRRRPEAQ